MTKYCISLYKQQHEWHPHSWCRATGGKHTYQNDASYPTSHILDTDTSESLDASTSLYLWLTPD